MEQRESFGMQLLLAVSFTPVGSLKASSIVHLQLLAACCIPVSVVVAHVRLY